MALIRSGFLVLSTNVVEFVANFLRNIVLARLLSVENFGAAATFALLATLIDLAGQIGLGQLVVQVRDAGDPRLQATLHTVQFGLGLVSALLLLALAWPYAYFMATPGHGIAYASLALIPIMRGLAHLDSMRLQRQGRFGPWAARQIIPPVAALLSAYPAYLWLGDYRVALVTIYVQQITALLATHLGAQWKFTFAFEREIVRRAITFGWPLMANSMLLYFVINGDRIIVSNQLGLETLGWFSAAIMLTMTPMNFVARSLQVLLLPKMSRQQDNSAALQQHYELTTSFMALVAVAFTAILALVGGHVLVLTFGEKFSAAAPYVPLLAAAQGIRLIRAGPALAAMAKGETRNPLYANMIRGVFIAAGLGVTMMTHSIFLLIVTGVIGEAVATLCSALLVRRKLGSKARQVLLVLATNLVACTAICLVALQGWPVWLVLAAVGVALLPNFRTLPQIIRLVRRAA